MERKNQKIKGRTTTGVECRKTPKLISSKQSFLSHSTCALYCVFLILTTAVSDKLILTASAEQKLGNEQNSSLAPMPAMRPEGNNQKNTQLNNHFPKNLRSGGHAQSKKEGDSPIAYLLLLDSYVDVSDLIAVSAASMDSLTFKRHGDSQDENLSLASRQNQSAKEASGISPQQSQWPPLPSFGIRPLPIHVSNQKGHSKTKRGAAGGKTILHDFLRVVPTDVASHETLDRLVAPTRASSIVGGNDMAYCLMMPLGELKASSFPSVCVRRVVIDAVGRKAETKKGGDEEKEDAKPTDVSTALDAGKHAEEASQSDDYHDFNLRPKWNRSSVGDNANSRRNLVQIKSIRGDGGSASGGLIPNPSPAKVAAQHYRKGVIDAVGTVDVVERMDLEDGVWPGAARRTRDYHYHDDARHTSLHGSTQQAKRSEAFSQKLRSHAALSEAAWENDVTPNAQINEENRGLSANNRILKRLKSSLSHKLLSIAANDNGGHENSAAFATNVIMDWLATSAGEGVVVGLFDSGISMKHEGFHPAAYADQQRNVYHEENDDSVDGTTTGDEHELVQYCRTFTGALRPAADDDRQQRNNNNNLPLEPLRYVEDLEGTEGCHDGYGHGTFVAGVVGSSGIPMYRPDDNNAVGNGGSAKKRNKGSSAGGGKSVVRRRRGDRARPDDDNAAGDDASSWKEKALGIIAEKRKMGDAFRSRNEKNANDKVQNGNGGEHEGEADAAYQPVSGRRPPAKCRGIAPASALHVFKTFTDDQISYTSYFLAALNEALQMGIDVINLSMGGYDYEDHPFVEKALELSAAGIAIVTAAGNDGPHWGTIYNPADQLDVVAVGAVNFKEQIAKFSSRGMTSWELPFGVGRPKPDVLAFGDPISGAAVRSGVCRSLAGTSMASPVVAGVLSLITSTILKRQALCEACDDMKRALQAAKKSKAGGHGVADGKDQSNDDEEEAVRQLEALIDSVCTRVAAVSPSFCARVAHSGVNVALLKQVLFATSRPLFPFRHHALPSNDESSDELPLLSLGVSSSLTDFSVLEHSIFAQGAGLVSAERAVALAASATTVKTEADRDGDIDDAIAAEEASERDVFMPHLSTFPSDLLIYGHPTSFVATKSDRGGRRKDPSDPHRRDLAKSLPPMEAQRVAEECEYMWPLCSQPIFFTSAPLRANLTLLNSVSPVAKKKRCYATLKHHKVLSRHIGVTVDCSERLWPHTGTAAVAFSVLRPFDNDKSMFGQMFSEGAAEEENTPSSHSSFLLPESERQRDFSSVIKAATRRYGREGGGGRESGEYAYSDDSATKGEDVIGRTNSTTVVMETDTYIIVEGTIEIEYETTLSSSASTAASSGSSSLSTLATSVPFRIKVLKHTPPRHRRLLWDVSHSIQFPFGYIPRDSLEKRGGSGSSAAAAADFLDWNGDHPCSNYAATFVHLVKARGYFIDTLASPQGLLEKFSRDGGPDSSEYPNHVLRVHGIDADNSDGSADDEPMMPPPVYDPSSSSSCDLSSIPSRYSALALVDTEDFFTPREVGTLHKMLTAEMSDDGRGGSGKASPRSWIAVNAKCPYVVSGRAAENLKATHASTATTSSTPTFGLVLISEWFNGPLLTKMGGVDDNTGTYWEPIVGGSNVPALNELLAPFNIQLSHTVVEGNGDAAMTGQVLSNEALAALRESTFDPRHYAPLLVMGGKDETIVIPATPSSDGVGNDDNYHYHHGKTIRPIFKSGGTIQVVPFSDQCQFCSIGGGGGGGEEEYYSPLRSDGRTTPQLGVNAGSAHERYIQSQKNHNRKQLAEDANVQVLDGGGFKNSYFDEGGVAPISIVSIERGSMPAVEARELLKRLRRGKSDGNDNGDGGEEKEETFDSIEAMRARGVGEHAALLFHRPSPSGRIAILTDSSCLDMGHHGDYPTATLAREEREQQQQQRQQQGHDVAGDDAPVRFANAAREYRQTFCFGTLDALLAFTMLPTTSQQASPASPSLSARPPRLNLQQPSFSLATSSNLGKGGGGGDKLFPLLVGSDELRCFPCDHGLEKNGLGAADTALSSPSSLAASFGKSIDILNNSTFTAPTDDATIAALPPRWDVFPCPVAPPSASGKSSQRGGAFSASSSMASSLSLCRSIIPFVKKLASAGGGDESPLSSSPIAFTPHPFNVLPIYFTAGDMAAHLAARLDAMRDVSWAARRRLMIVEANGDDDWDRHRMRRGERDEKEREREGEEVMRGQGGGGRRGRRGGLPMIGADEALEEDAMADSDRDGRIGADNQPAALSSSSSSSQRTLLGGGGDSDKKKMKPAEVILVMDEHYEEEEGGGEKVSEGGENRIINGEPQTSSPPQPPLPERDEGDEAGPLPAAVVNDDAPADNDYGPPDDEQQQREDKDGEFEIHDGQMKAEGVRKKQMHPSSTAGGGRTTKGSPRQQQQNIKITNPSRAAADSAKASRPPAPTPAPGLFTFSLSNPYLPLIVFLYLLKWYIKYKILSSKKARRTIYSVLLVRMRLLPFVEQLGLVGVVRRMGCLPPFGDQHDASHNA